MAYSEELAARVRAQLNDIPNVIEKPMMGGLTFMVNDKMCVGILASEIMCRIDPAVEYNALEQNGCRKMDFTGRPMKGFVMIEDTAIGTKSELKYWIDLALDFNSRAKSSKKAKKTK